MNLPPIGDDNDLANDFPFLLPFLSSGDLLDDGRHLGYGYGYQGWRVKLGACRHVEGTQFAIELENPNWVPHPELVTPERHAATEARIAARLKDFFLNHRSVLHGITKAQWSYSDQGCSYRATIFAQGIPPVVYGLREQERQTVEYYIGCLEQNNHRPTRAEMLDTLQLLLRRHDELLKRPR